PTTVFYPALAQHGHGQPDVADGPYPLVVFAPGLGSPPNLGRYRPLLRAWASDGYVVAAPTFPLTNAATPGGPDAADFVNQPGDMRFVIDQILARSDARRGLLSGLVDKHRIGVAGHSLGGVTALAVDENTCCRDGRVRAAVIISGDPLSFPGGSPRPDRAPALLFVHGDADSSVPYAASVRAFDAARSPKGLLTVNGGGHSTPVEASNPAFPAVVAVTKDFFDAYVKGSARARNALEKMPTSSSTRFVFAASGESRVTVPVPTMPGRHRQVVISPSGPVADHEQVAVHWSGFSPNVNVNVLECWHDHPSQPTDCDLGSAQLLRPDPAGSGTLTLQVHTGAVGAGTCPPGSSSCVVAVNEGGSFDPAATVTAPITFAPAS
ncbi:MAG TPA: neocarzinostatin apoprotein domain-containing protein, partial [Mycobacterium sp.]|nr:neocarzinostatin apoprotein domain-containing protein [Mycobacterium sp.]